MVRIIVDDADTGWWWRLGNTKAAAEEEVRFAVNSVANETRFFLCRNKPVMALS